MLELKSCTTTPSSFADFYLKIYKPDIIAHTCIPSTPEMEDSISEFEASVKSCLKSGGNITLEKYKLIFKVLYFRPVTLKLWNINSV